MLNLRVMTPCALANFRIALDSSVIALAIFFQALGAFASTSLFMCIAHYFVSKSPRVLGENSRTCSLYSCFFSFGVEAIVALAAR